MMYNETGTGQRSIGQTLKYLIAILPLYVSSAIFKAGSIAIFFIFFGGFAYVGLGVIFVGLLLITLRMQFSIGDGVILALSNLTVVNYFIS